MDGYVIDVIKNSVMFKGIDESEIRPLLKCLSSKLVSYDKNDYVFRVGDELNRVGIIISGSVHIVKEDFWGNKNIITQSSPGQVFGEAYACSDRMGISVSVIAAEKTEILFVDINRVLQTCSSACNFHGRLIRNLVTVLAERNLLLNQKIDYMSNRTTKDKLLSYLSSESQKNKSPKFNIPFNRQQLADFLCVDRSAMSNELSKLRDEGIIKFNKNSFELLQSTL